MINFETDSVKSSQNEIKEYMPIKYLKYIRKVSELHLLSIHSITDIHHGRGETVDVPLNLIDLDNIPFYWS